jgi:hypothetical protein
MTFFQDSLTIAPIGSHSPTIHAQARHDPLDAETREFQRFVQRKLVSIEESLKPTQSPVYFSQSIRLLIQWIAVRSISFRAIDSDLFKEFCKSLNPQFKMPCRKTLTNIISEMANFEITFPIPSIPDYCSLMLDGATKFGHILLAVILFSQGHAHFLDLLELPDQKSKTIAFHVARHRKALGNEFDCYGCLHRQCQ